MIFNVPVSEAQTQIKSIRSLLLISTLFRAPLFFSVTQGIKFIGSKGHGFSSPQSKKWSLYCIPVSHVTSVAKWLWILLGKALTGAAHRLFQSQALSMCSHQVSLVEHSDEAFKLTSTTSTEGWVKGRGREDNNKTTFFSEQLLELCLVFFFTVFLHVNMQWLDAPQEDQLDDGEGTADLES